MKTNKMFSNSITKEIVRNSLVGNKNGSFDKKISNTGRRLNSKPISAAVLVLIVGHQSGAKVVLTKRSKNLTHHAGQISFPGGRVDEQDDNLETTALRETNEEIGISPNTINILGRLPDYDVLTGFRITPIVGWAKYALEYFPAYEEVDEGFELPLNFILEPKNSVKHSKTIDGVIREYYSISYEGRYVWGATAAILVNLSHAIRLHACN